MKPVLHESRAERVAGWLRERIANGGLEGRLPGLRELARELGVSVPTVSQGIRLLEDEGWVESGGMRRCHRVVGRPIQQAVEAEGRRGTTRRLLFLTSEPFNQILQDGMNTFSELVNTLQEAGWEVLHRSNDFKNALKPHRSWERFMEWLNPDALVVLVGTPVVARWALDRGIRVLFIGGDAGPHRVPLMAIRIGSLIQEVIERLQGSGHRQILMPLCGRTAAFTQAIRDTARVTLDLRAAGKCRFRIEQTAYREPEVLMELLEKAWKKGRPDALVVLDWREYVTVSCFLKRHGIRVPEDLSVVLLSYQDELDWHLPRLAHYRYPSERIAQAVARWAVHERPLAAGGRVKIFPAHWVQGESIVSR